MSSLHPNYHPYTKLITPYLLIILSIRITSRIRFLRTALIIPLSDILRRLIRIIVYESTQINAIKMYATVHTHINRPQTLECNVGCVSIFSLPYKIVLLFLTRTGCEQLVLMSNWIFLQEASSAWAALTGSG